MNNKNTQLDSHKLNSLDYKQNLIEEINEYIKLRKSLYITKNNCN